MVKSSKFDLYLQDKELHRKILQSIQLYRTISRHAFTACAMSEIAGADIAVTDNTLKITPNKDAAKKILSETFCKDGKAHLYQLRDLVREDLAPTWLSFVWDSLRSDVSSRWLAKDPKFPKATKGWLLLQGSRGINFFQHVGIGLPQASARPKIDGHKVILKWDHEIGPVEFNIGKLDGGRYHVLKGVRDNLPGWKAGTFYLNERDGKLFLLMSYTCPDPVTELDKNNVLEVTFTEEADKYITLKGPGNFHGDCISALEALGLLHSLNVRRERWQARKQAAGNPRRTWGSKKICNATQEVISNITTHRENAVQTRNHLWTRRIIDNALRWECGTVKVVNLPEKSMFNEPWNWSQFKNFLAYKTKEIGGVLI
jgi:hypothetical protein